MTIASTNNRLDAPCDNPSLVAVWDLGTRLYHWIQALLVSLLLATGFSGNGETALHILSGLVLTVVLCWRWLWGLVGGSAAKFAGLPLGAGQVRRFVRSGRHPGYGHNPLAAWMMLILLTGLSMQALGGLVMAGLLLPPEAVLVWLEQPLLQWHQMFPFVLIGLIGAHVAAALIHGLKGDRVVTAMIDGRKRLQPDAPPVTTRTGLFSLLVLISALILVLVTILLSQL